MTDQDPRAAAVAKALEDGKAKIDAIKKRTLAAIAEADREEAVEQAEALKAKLT